MLSLLLPLNYDQEKKKGGGEGGRKCGGTVTAQGKSAREGDLTSCPRGSYFFLVFFFPFGRNRTERGKREARVQAICCRPWKIVWIASYIL